MRHPEDLEILTEQLQELNNHPVVQPVNEFGWPTDMTFGLDALAKRAQAYRARVDARKAAKLSAADNEVLARVFPLD